MAVANVKGFTLIELLVAIVIIAILASIGVPEFRTFLLNTQIKTASEAINNGLQLARGEAVRRNTPVQFNLGAGTGWTVGCEIPIADADGDDVDECPAVIQSRSAGEGSASAIVTTEPAGATTVTFNGLGRVIANDDGTPSITRFNIDMPSSLLDAERSKDMSILTAGGSIRMCDPNNATPGDARAC
ncbi:MAG TPA: GspH/FimT family pseudopilin [Methylophilaceae bacterium]|nr:GspH/FimT family pseudopilin [Vitreimonas sp.]HYG32923.1 GspH/FimT family pseudopilin [Methylophilaceae bacterium]